MLLRGSFFALCGYVRTEQARQSRLNVVGRVVKIVFL